MTHREEILTYLKEKYAPLTIALYGSYAEGTQDEHSDFDCLLITKTKDRAHDDAVVGGVMLDCFIYTEEEIRRLNLEEFLPLFGAQLTEDTGLGAALQKRVQDYVQRHSKRAPEEKEFLRSWIRKTMRRMEKGDAEGDFRAIAFLAESLEDYDLLRDRFYFGSKKALQALRKEDASGFALFQEAISQRSNEAILAWGQYVLGD